MFIGSRFTNLNTTIIGEFKLDIFNELTYADHKNIKEIAEFTNINIINPVDYLCNNRSCPITNSEGVPLYKDSTHMTATYARENAIFIDETIRH